MNTGWLLAGRAPLLVMLLVALVACGGGGSAPSSEGRVIGTATKGPVADAVVTAHAIDAGTMGRVIGTARTDNQGNFSIAVGAYSGAVMLQMSGGHFMNEATGIDMPMQQGDVMTAMIASLSPGAIMNGIQMTPLTSMAQTMAGGMPGGMTAQNIALAHAAVGAYFMVGDILHVRPMNPLVPGAATGADADMRNYGMAMAAMSQLAANLGMPSASGIVTAMMDDVSDGRMDGMMGVGGPVMMRSGMMGGVAFPSDGGTSRLSNAMAQFILSPMNRSGVSTTDMQALINRLMTASGAMR